MFLPITEVPEKENPRRISCPFFFSSLDKSTLLPGYLILKTVIQQNCSGIFCTEDVVIYNISSLLVFTLLRHIFCLLLCSMPLLK